MHLINRYLYVYHSYRLLFLSCRYTAICHPLKPSLHSGKRRTICIIVTIWIVCMIPSAWMLIYAKVTKVKKLNRIKIQVLNFNFKHLPTIWIFFRFSTCFTVHGRNQLLEELRKRLICVNKGTLGQKNLQRAWYEILIIKTIIFVYTSFNAVIINMYNTI